MRTKLTFLFCWCISVLYQCSIFPGLSAFVTLTNAEFRAEVLLRFFSTRMKNVLACNDVSPRFDLLAEKSHLAVIKP